MNHNLGLPNGKEVDQSKHSFTVCVLVMFLLLQCGGCSKATVELGDSTYDSAEYLDRVQQLGVDRMDAAASAVCNTVKIDEKRERVAAQSAEEQQNEQKELNQVVKGMKTALKDGKVGRMARSLKRCHSDTSQASSIDIMETSEN